MGAPAWAPAGAGHGEEPVSCPVVVRRVLVGGTSVRIAWLLCALLRKYAPPSGPSCVGGLALPCGGCGGVGNAAGCAGRGWCLCAGCPFTSVGGVRGCGGALLGPGAAVPVVPWPCALLLWGVWGMGLLFENCIVDASIYGGAVPFGRGGPCVQFFLGFFP